MVGESNDRLNLEAQVGNKVYQLSERDGALRVSLDGQLVATESSGRMTGKLDDTMTFCTSFKPSK